MCSCSMNSRAFWPQQVASEQLKSVKKHSRTQSFEAILFPDVAGPFCRLPFKILWTRDSQPWRPDAVMGATERQGSLLIE